MLIAPVIFCTIVLGMGAIRKAASVGRIGGLALAYFLAMSTVALAIGLVVGNLLHPGNGLQLSDELRGQGSSLATEAEGSGGTTDFVLSLSSGCSRWSCGWPRSVPSARSPRSSARPDGTPWRAWASS
jgi:aerobic C4-dicarboxylate transport protein